MKCQPTQILSFQCFSQSMKQQLQSQLTVSPETGERPEKKELKIRLCRLSPVYIEEIYVLREYPVIKSMLDKLHFYD